MMIRKWFLVAVLALMAAGPVAVAGQQAQPATPQGRTTIAELKKLMDSGQVIVLDVRNAEAYRLGHIPGAVLAPVETVASRAQEWKSSTAPIVTYCS